MSSALKTLFALLVILIVLVGGGLIYMYAGAYNVAATDEHAGLVEWVLSTTQEESIQAHADEMDIAVPTDSTSLRRGYRAFEAMCAPCHGAPGVERGWMGKGLNPEPPELSHAVEEFSETEVYWIIRHGIKMTGMPALAPTHGEQEILNLTAFVKHLEGMSEDEYRTWGEQAAADTVRAGDGHDHVH